MIEWCLCDIAAATASCASMDLDGFLERTASGDLFRRAGRRADGKRQPARCPRKTQDKFAIVSWQRSFCAVAYARMHERICIFLRRVCMHLDQCFGHHACAGVYIRQVLWTSAYTFANKLATGCAYALMHVQFVQVRSALGERGWGWSTSLWGHLLLGVWGYFLIEGKMTVLFVSSLCLTWVEVYVGVCVCIRTHTHTLHRWSTRMWAQESGWDTWRARRIQMD